MTIYSLSSRRTGYHRYGFKNYPDTSAFLPQAVWPHWGLLAESVKTRCLTETFAYASGIFPVISHTKYHKIVFVKCPCAFRLRRLAQNDVRGLGVRLLSCKFPHKTGLVTCPCACRLYRDFAKRPLLDIFFRDLAKRHLAEILLTELLSRSCAQISCGELLLAPCAASLAQGYCTAASTEISYRHLVQLASHLSWISSSEILPKTLCRDLANRALPCAKILCGDILQAPCTELLSRLLVQSRSSVEISYRHLVQLASHRDLAQQLLQRTSSTEIFAHLAGRIWSGSCSHWCSAAHTHSFCRY